MWFDSTTATKQTTMENTRIEYQYTISPITILGGATQIEQHLRVDIGDAGSDEYNHISLLAEIAIRYVEQLTGRHVQAKNAIVDIHTLHDRIELPFRLNAITSFTYTNDQHVETSVTADDVWRIHNRTSPSVLERKLAYQMPTDWALDDPYPWRIECTVAGDVDVLTTSTSQTSRLFVGAGLMHLAHLYENREAAGFTTGKPYVQPLAFESIVKTLKRIR